MPCNDGYCPCEDNYERSEVKSFLAFVNAFFYKGIVMSEEEALMRFNDRFVIDKNPFRLTKEMVQRLGNG